LRRDIQVEPLSVGADFKFPVVFLAEAIGLKKHLGHVAFPQLVSAPVRAAIRKNADCAVVAPKAKIQHGLRPQHPNFCLPLRIVVLALPVVAKPERGLPVPIPF
jgi:hypothetical protein